MKICVKSYCYNRPGTRKTKKGKTPKKAYCKPGTIKMHGRNCMCKTRGGGYKTIAKARCKRR